MNKTITSLLTLISILDKMDTQWDDTIHTRLHRVPREYVADFESISDALSTEWRSAGIDNTWLTVQLPNLEVTVWFE